MKRIFLALVGCLLLPSGGLAAEKSLPRILVGLYDSRWESSPRTSHIHRFLEMPANHLGFDIQYYDVNEKLPALGDDVAGIVAWFNAGIEVPDAHAYLSWLNDALAHGKKLLIIENAGIGDRHRKDPAAMQQWNEVLGHLGLEDDNSWNELTYHASIERMDKAMVGFEHSIGPLLPPFTGTHAIAGAADSHLRIRLDDTGEVEHFDLVTTSPQGGYIAEDYAIFYQRGKDKSDINQWIVDPFLFLRKALDVRLSPAPDVTTLDGRRIFYSHIDGDGWNNISELPAYEAKLTLAAEVIYKEILEPYDDFPFTVGLIAADADPTCYGVEDSERVAREIFVLPNVEPGSHTYSHPLFWQFFAHYSPELEKPLLGRYPSRPRRNMSLTESIRDFFSGSKWAKPVSPQGAPELPHAVDIQVKRGRNEESVEDMLRKYYHTPRSYACSPFNLEQEIVGSVRRVNELSPARKQSKLLQWSGDAGPFEAALAMAREAGIRSINGGSSRFDNEHPSYSYVAPIGIKVGKERQIYASGSNENTYTDLWTGRFFGYRDLKITLQNTESPRRVLPFNLYFHIFSGQKEASLLAVKENLAYARTQDIIPITTSRFVDIAEGFYSADIRQTGDAVWHVRRRAGLETLRFDDATNLSVDFAASQGVLGQRYFQGNLYAALDPAAEDIVIALKKNAGSAVLPKERMPYLVESSWEIRHAQNTNNALTFETQGYGRGIMRWKMPAGGEYTVKIVKKQEETSPFRQFPAAVSEDGLLSLSLDETQSPEPFVVTIGAP